jgi:hypothetical protein
VGDKSRPSLAQYLANKTGLVVWGYTGKVNYYESGGQICVPEPEPGAVKQKFVSTTPSVGKFESGGMVDLSNQPTGLTLQWSVSTNLSTCDVHITLLDNVNPNKFKNFKGAEGWKGSAKTEGGVTVLTWYDPNCGQSLAPDMIITVDLLDPKAKDKGAKPSKVVFTGNGKATYKPSDVIKEGTTEVPRFALVEPPMRPRTPTPSSIPVAGPPPAETWTFFAGGGLTGSSGEVALVERLPDGLETNRFNESRGALGGTAELGYNVTMAHQMFLGVLAAVNIRNLVQRHTFPSGFYLGSTIDLSASALARVGYGSPSTVAVSALAGVSLAREKVDIFLGGPVTAANHAVIGATFGVEAETALRGLSQALGTRITGAIRLTHTRWSPARESRPPASPGFVYDALAREGMASFVLRAYLP